MKKLCDIQAGGRFLYGGVEWVKLDNANGGVLALSADRLFNRAFDEENCNDWRSSSLRRYLNGEFLDTLIKNGADPEAFMDWESDLTADDGMTDYGTATDKIALRSDALCRKYRTITPAADGWCWNLTPWTCDPEYKAFVRGVYSDGTLSDIYAYGYYGVRPLCYLKSDILVSIPGEENDEAEKTAQREEMKREATEAVLSVLNDYPVQLWGEVLAAAVASVFWSKQEAEEIAQENRDRARMEG